jgi:hypothetical protein
MGNGIKKICCCIWGSDGLLKHSWGQGGGAKPSPFFLSSQWRVTGSALFHMVICLLDTWTYVLLSKFLVQIVVQFSFILTSLILIKLVKNILTSTILNKYITKTYFIENLAKLI